MCIAHVNGALTKLEGVSEVNVSLENKNAEIVYTGDVSDASIKAAVEEAGYKVTDIK